jgi:hypothetical protein
MLPVIAKLETALRASHFNLRGFLLAHGGGRVTLQRGRRNVMQGLSTPPSTLDGIKRLAKKIQAEQKSLGQRIPYHQALNLASRVAGFENFAHAHRVLTGADQQIWVHLTCYWLGRVDGVLKYGRETLGIPMSKALDDIVRRHQLDHARHLTGFRLECADHLERKLDVESQERAKTELRRAARTLQFMTATGLRPATTQRERLPIVRKFEHLPGDDHYSLWMSQDGKGWVYMDEPYEKPVLEKRAAWAKQQGMTMLRPSWEGLYYPGSTIPFLFGVDDVLIGTIEDKIEHLPKAEDEDGWS